MGSSDTSGTATIGSSWRTRFRSNGLSSMKHSESRPMFSSCAMARMLSALFVPVGDEAGDVAALEHHVRVLLERLQRIGFIVF